MALTDAMVALYSTTLAAATSSVTIAGIPTTGYRDLRLVITTNSSNSIWIRANGDTGSNYSQVTMYGNGTSAGSNAGTITGFFAGYNITESTISDIFDYSATDKHKTCLNRSNASSHDVNASASRWANTAAINSLTIVAETSTFPIGSTFSLFGIKA